MIDLLKFTLGVLTGSVVLTALLTGLLVSFRKARSKDGHGTVSSRTDSEQPRYIGAGI